MSRRPLPAQQWSARREALLRAAASQMAEEGVAGVTLDQVARRAGVSKGAVQYAFGSKDELLAALARWVVGSFVAEGVGRPGSLEQDSFTGIVDDLTEGLASDHDRLLAMLTMVHIGRSEAWARRPLVEYHGTAARRIAPAMGAALRRSGRMEGATPADDELMAQGVRALILGMYTHWTVHPAGRSRADVARQVRRILSLMFGLPDAGAGDRLAWGEHPPPIAVVPYEVSKGPGPD